MNGAPALPWIAAFRRSLAAALCVFVLFAALHVHAEAGAAQAVASVAGQTAGGGEASDALPCPVLSHHCCEAASLPPAALAYPEPAQRDASFHVTAARIHVPGAPAPPPEPPRT